MGHSDENQNLTDEELRLRLMNLKEKQSHHKAGMGLWGTATIVTALVVWPVAIFAAVP
eukprot:Pgem_evm1s947